jgi:hypothetical protein
MKAALIALLFAASAVAQAQTVAAAACGPKDAGFDVKLDKSQHALAQPEPGKARVYFIQETAGLKVVFWMDGAWVGANRHDSYFSVSVEPGEHHACVNVQSIFGHPVGLAHFTAEAGKIYYFNARVIDTRDDAFLFFGAEDSDQAKYQIASFPLSVSTPLSESQPRK